MRCYISLNLETNAVGFYYLLYFCVFYYSGDMEDGSQEMVVRICVYLVETDRK
jgi:hypothetical protein